MIDFRCTNCGKLLRTGPETAGKRAKCPDCGTILMIPLSGGPAPAMPGGALPAAGMPPAQPPQGPSVNPFQSPQAPLGGAAPAPAGPITPATLDMNDLFATTWAVMKANLGMAIALPLVPGLVMMIVTVVAVFTLTAVAANSTFLFLVLGMMAVAGIVVLSLVMNLGVLKAFLKLARGQPTAFGDIFAFGPELVPFVLTGLLLSAVVSLGTMACIIPGYFLAIMFSQCIYLVIDRNVGVLDSFNMSKDLTNGNKMTIFLTFLILGLIAPFAVLLTCGIGSLFVFPFAMLLQVVTYLRLTGQPIAAPMQ